MASTRKSWGIAAVSLAVAAVSAALFLLPRRQVTTSSDRAYREYVEGNEDYDRMYFADARRHYEKALSDDPKFVMAMVRRRPDRVLRRLREHPASPGGPRSREPDCAAA